MVIVSQMTYVHLVHFYSAMILESVCLMYEALQRTFH